MLGDPDGKYKDGCFSCSGVVLEWEANFIPYRNAISLFLLSLFSQYIYTDSSVHTNRTYKRSLAGQWMFVPFVYSCFVNLLVI